MEGQNDGAVGVIHLDPAYLLVGVGGLVNAAAIVRFQEVGKRCGGRQVGVDLEQVVGAVAVLEAECTLLRLLRLGNFTNSGPGRAIPHCIEGGLDLYGGGIVVNDRAFHNGYHFPLVIQLFQADGGGIQVTVEGGIFHFYALQQDSALKTDGGAVSRCAEVIDVGELHQAIHGKAGCQGHIGHQFTGRAVSQCYILGFRDLRDFGNRNPFGAIPLGIKGLGHHHGRIAVIDHRIL